MRFKLLAVTLLLMPTPALADITATYAAGNGTFTAQVADGGDARIGIDGKFVLIRHDGVDHVVIYTPDGAPHVARADAALAKFADTRPVPHAFKTELTSEGDATVAGYAGSVWRFGPEKDQPLELVMSGDAGLAPIGQLFARIATVFMTAMDAKAGPDSNAGQGTAALFSHGTPLRVAETAVEPKPGKVMIELRSVSRAEIDAHRFDLPGPVMAADAFFAMVAPPPPTDVEAIVEEPTEKPKPKR